MEYNKNEMGVRLIIAKQLYEDQTDNWHTCHITYEASCSVMVICIVRFSYVGTP